jgi:hypothetical protein
MKRAMISKSRRALRHWTGAAACVIALTAGFATTTPAAARVWVGFGFGLPGFYVAPPPYYYPPYYYPPPVYYAPPAYYPPPASYAPANAAPPPAAGPTGQTCFAGGSNTCPMDRPVASGAACYCLGSDGSRIWGHAN